MTGVFGVQYIKWNDIFEHERPFMLFVDTPEDHADQRKTNVEFEQHETTIHDLREDKVQRFNIDANGFNLRDVSEVADIHDSQDFDEKYIPIVKDIIRQECSGCDEVLITSWRVSTETSLHACCLVQRPKHRVSTLISSSAKELGRQ